VREATASAEHQAIDATAFTALLDSLRVALVRSRQHLSRRWPVPLALIIAMYAFQTATAFTATTSQAAKSVGAMFVMIFFAVGIA
jgi:hypothetical protein